VESDRTRVIMRVNIGEKNNLQRENRIEKAIPDFPKPVVVKHRF
jgi:hypothetical protein